MGPEGPRRPLRRMAFTRGPPIPGTERFDQIIIRPQGQPGDPVHLFSPGREHQDGNVRRLPEPPAHFPVIHQGKHQIEDDQNRFMMSGQLKGLSPIMGDDRLETFPLQVEGHRRGRLPIIFNDEDGTFHLQSSPLNLAPRFRPIRRIPRVRFLILPDENSGYPFSPGTGALSSGASQSN